MRHTIAFSTLSLATLLAACSPDAKVPVGPASPDASNAVTSKAAAISTVRPRKVVTGLADARTLVPIALLSPGAANGIGTGSALLITIPGAGTFGCTANFIWTAGGQRYLGSAGHCFLPADRSATHGAGADFDPSGVIVEVCVSSCDGNFDANQLLGTWVRLGRVAYARQSDTEGNGVGNDFGLVEIPSAVAELVRTSMPVWGGPRGTSTLATGTMGCHYGHGLVVGELFPTKARVGIGGGADANAWMGDFAAAFGDSGSGMVACGLVGLGIGGAGAVGVLTHLGVSADPATLQHGFVFGTTIRRAIEMAREASLDLALVSS